MSDTTDIEKKSLEAHVELCAERYKLLEHKMLDVETTINEVKKNVNSIGDTINVMANKRSDQLIAWGVGIIGFLLATVGWLLQHYVLK
jgi:hypothetical protein